MVLRCRGTTFSVDMVVMFSALLAGGPLFPGRFLVLISVRGRVDPRAIIWLEGLGQLKNQATSSVFESATSRLEVYCLNQLCYHIPHLILS
jgi:hypothetical protein